LASYARLIAACYLAAVLFILILAAIVRYFASVNLWKFLVYIKDELFLALGTASTEVVLPRITSLALVLAPAERSTNTDGPRSGKDGAHPPALPSVRSASPGRNCPSGVRSNSRHDASSSSTMPTSRGSLPSSGCSLASAMAG
jgi:hypothetical protein